MKGRKPKLTLVEQREFATMYRDLQYTKADLQFAFRISRPTLADYAVRLGLPLRGPEAPIARSRDMEKWRASWRATMKRKEAEQAVRLDLPLEPIGDELPTCFVCSGRSQSWDGHDVCRGRGRKSA